MNTIGGSWSEEEENKVVPRLFLSHREESRKLSDIYEQTEISALWWWWPVTSVKIECWNICFRRAGLGISLLNSMSFELIFSFEFFLSSKRYSPSVVQWSSPIVYTFMIICGSSQISNCLDPASLSKNEPAHLTSTAFPLGLWPCRVSGWDSLHCAYPVVRGLLEQNSCYGIWFQG